MPLWNLFLLCLVVIVRREIAIWIEIAIRRTGITKIIAETAKATI